MLKKNAVLTILNLNGKQLVMKQITAPQTVIDVSDLPQGIYCVHVTDNQKVHISKFIRQ